MPSLDYVTLDVFTSEKFLGNPLAVVKVPHGTDLDQDTKQIIAREFNYSETVFLHLPSGNDHASSAVPEYKIDIFLTSAEVPFAGHPTIGTAVYALTAVSPAAKGRFICKAGPIELDFDQSTKRAKASIPFNTHLHSRQYAAERVCALQPGLKKHLQSTGQTFDDKHIQVLSVVNGMTFIFVKLPSVEALGSVSLHGQEIVYQRDEGWDKGFVGSMYYVVLPAQGDGVTRLRTRMLENKFEDPATGSASSGLGALLVKNEGFKGGKKRFEMTQAVEMGRQSDIGVDVTVDGSGELKTIELIGTAVQVMEGTVRY